MLVRQKQRVEPVQQLVLERFKNQLKSRLPRQDLGTGDGIDSHAVLALAVQLHEPLPHVRQLERQRWRFRFGRRTV